MEKRESSCTAGKSKMIQPLWRRAWRFLKKLRMKLLCDPEISLLVMYPEKKLQFKRTHVPPLFTTALLKRARIRKHLDVH